MTRFTRALLLLFALVALALVPKHADADQPAQDTCAHALDLADTGMRQLGNAQPTDRDAIAAYYLGQRHRMMRLARSYSDQVVAYQDTMTAYHAAAAACRDQ